jgi:hypothetical protein
MITIIKKELTKHAAELRTAGHKRDFALLKKGWLHLGREVQKSIDLGVPGLLGKTMREWMAGTFDESASHIFRQLQSYRALKGVPEATLAQISESNAHELTKLNEKDRKAPEIVRQAVEQTPKDFKETVSQIRKEKYGIEPDEFRTFAIRVPETVYNLLSAAECKMANILDLPLAYEKTRPANTITVWEAIAQLINGTDIEILRAEIEGKVLE